MPENFDASTPIVHVISDSLGDTACEVVLAAAGQFDEGSIRISRLPKVTDISQVASYLDTHSKRSVKCAVFHTIVNTDLRHAVMEECVKREIPTSFCLEYPALRKLRFPCTWHFKDIASRISRSLSRWSRPSPFLKSIL